MFNVYSLRFLKFRRPALLFTSRKVASGGSRFVHIRENTTRRQMSLDVRLYKPRQPFAGKCRVRYEPTKRSKCLCYRIYSLTTTVRVSRAVYSIRTSVGLALTPDDFLTAVVTPQMSADYFRPWRQLATAAREVGSNIKVDKDKFQVSLDVQHFAPEEISVKTVEGFVVVEGKHEEKEDEHGFISRQFLRRYALPEGCEAETVQSKLSSDGVLTIIAPRKIDEAVKGERAIPIERTGPVRKEIKEQEEPKEQKTEE
ncbi:Protein lethal(2)essential for life [Eumeta japonica]|uniref:Protein lethal(2)essential for life n=1 Tax=Eumeta variegata TaxID=151549 RepID=A0A4C1UQF3_EUMVA|nr:Protein lethal(2)essential for life [Eumeta japonica]